MFYPDLGIQDKTLIELLDVIRFSAAEASKRRRFLKIKLEEVDAEFKKIIRTIRLGRHIAKTGYRYLHATSKTVNGQIHINIQARLTAHGTKAIVTTTNWKDFVCWVDGYWVDKPNNLEQWKKKYGKKRQAL